MSILCVSQYNMCSMMYDTVDDTIEKEDAVVDSSDDLVKKDSGSRISLFSINRDLLFDGLSTVQSVVERRNSIELLSCLRMTATGGSAMTITATNMDIESSVRIDVQCGVDFDLAVPAQLLYDIVRKMIAGESVDISSDGSSRLYIESTTCQFNVPFLSPTSFPRLEFEEYDTRFTLNAATFVGIVNKIKFAISSEEVRYYLNGVHFGKDAGDDNIAVVATDGHRLSRYKLSCADTGLSDDMALNIIIPKKALQELTKILPDQGEDLEIYLFKKRVKFVCGNLVLISNLIDGRFPKCDDVIPSKYDTRLFVDRKLLASALDRVSTVVYDKAIKAVKFSIDISELSISATSSDQCQASEKVEASFEGTYSKLDIGFNSRYILDVLSVIGSETVEVCFKGVNDPVMINDKEDLNVCHIVMPMLI